MTAQHSLFDPGPADGALTNWQRMILEAAHEAGSRGGITAGEAGSLIHSKRALHPESQRCLHCVGTGRGVLEALKKRQLLKKRKSGVYQPVRKRARPDQWPAGF